ncbi:hypothetical protein KA977_14610 [Candidatus Dependentiae bacterium]|nr:hypothetical protein [Candidatus Dependentiae bacterium]
MKRNGGSAGIDNQTIEKFEAKTEIYLQEICEALETEKYIPDKIKRPGYRKQEKQKCVHLEFL